MNSQIVHSIEHVGVLADCQFFMHGHTWQNKKETDMRMFWATKLEEGMVLISEKVTA